MALKSFLSPTGSGKLIFEGEVVNGFAVPDGSSVVVKFFPNDRGYTAAAFGQSEGQGVALDLAGARGLRDELAGLIEQHGGRAGVFKELSPQKRFSLTRELAEAPLILGIHGTDPRFGACFHRGDAEALKKIVAEFDAVLKVLDDTKNAPAAAPAH